MTLTIKESGKFYLPKKTPPLGSELGAVIKNDPRNCPKTGDWKTETPVIDKNVCIGCGMCEQHCPEAAIRMKKNNGQKKPVINYQFCKGCGICAEVCPVKAIQMRRGNEKRN